MDQPLPSPVKARRVAPLWCAAVHLLLAPHLPAADLEEKIDAAMSAGKYAAARPLAELHVQSQSRKSLTSPELARAQQVLGSIEDRLGHHASALHWHQRAWSTYHAAHASEESLAACAEEAAMAAQSAQDPTRALHWQHQALTHRTKAIPPSTARTAITRARLAELLLRASRLSEAAAAATTAQIEARTDPTALFLTERCLGVIAHTLGRWEEAIGYFQQARIAAAQLGAETPILQAALDGQIGQSLLRAERPTEADPYLTTAQATLSAHDPSSPEAIAALNNLAALWLTTNRAPEVAEKILNTLSAHPQLATASESMTLWLQLATAQLRLRQLPAAAAALTRARALPALPPIHPLRAQLALTTACLAAEQGDTSAAATAATQHATIAIAWLQQAAAEKDETRLLDFHRTIDPISPMVAFASADPEALAAVILASKGTVLHHILQKNHPTPPPAPTLAEVRRTLPPEAVLIDYIRWRPASAGGHWDPAGRYGALIIRPHPPATWIDLGPAPAIDKRLRRLIAAGRDTIARDAEAADRASLDYQCAQLWQLIWAPLLPALAGTSSVLIRPDAMLHFTPWSVLRAPSSQHFCTLYPRYEIIAFPRPRPTQPPPHHWHILAVPEAPLPSSIATPQPHPPWLTPSLLQELRDMPALPGTLTELSAIKSSAPPHITVHTPPPIESSFHAPTAGIIHFAGHGFARAIPAWAGGTTIQAGLVMRDCATSLRTLHSSADGILLTTDAAALPLQHTTAVILSGCQTALGQWQAGEHMTGLRHAFLTAGAGSVASTLWDLNDTAAPEIVRKIYTHLAAGDPPTHAVAAAQRAWLQSATAAALTPGLRTALAGAWVVESTGWTP